MFACRPAKNIQKTENVIPRVDTVVISENKSENQKPVVESSHEDVFEKINKNKILFSSFNAKARIQYEGNEGGDDATAFIRLKKDSIIWLSLRGPLGIEGFRVLITKDSVKIMDLLKKNVQYRTIDFLQEITGIPFDFSTLQDFIVGNPVFIDRNIISYKAAENNTLLVLMQGSFFKNLVSLDNNDFKILHSQLTDVDVTKNRTSDITFSDYENTAGAMFSSRRKISVTDKSKMNISVDFKQYSFNQSLTFPFNTPRNYKRL